MIIKTNFKFFLFFLIFLIKNDKPWEKVDPLYKINVSYSEFSSKVNQIIHCSHELKKIYVLNKNGELLYSHNFGGDYYEVKSKLLDLGEEEVINLYQNPNDLEHIVFITMNGKIWQTHNCGETYEKVLDGIKLLNYLFHPLDKDKAIVNSFNECNNSKDEKCIKQWELMFSKDKGVTWKKISSTVIDYKWTKRFDDDIFSSRDRIIYTKVVSKDNINTEYLMYTDDFMKTENVIADAVENFKMTDEFLIIKKDTQDQKGNQYFSSNIFGFFYHFNPILLNIVPEYGFDLEILPTKLRGMTYMTASFDSNGILVTNLYYAVNFGSKYELILENIVCELGNSQCDIQIIESLDGVIIANIYDKNYMVYLNSVNLNKRSSNNFVEKLDNLTKHIKTVISYDYGKSWQSIKKPEYGFSDCYECNLNLFLPFSKNFLYSSIVSSKTAPGVIIALGQVNKHLNHKSKIAVYISVDGGLNWKHSLSGNFYFNLIDQGGFIIAYERNKKTSNWLLSHDLGEKWTYLKLSNHGDFFITGISTTNLKKDKKFIVYGYKKDKYNYKAVINTVNLSNWHEKNCIYSKDKKISDYEVFMPINLTGNKCFNGREIEYLRKKRDRLCFNGLHFELYKIIKTCKCTEDDWYCDFGYEKNEQGKCILITEKNKNDLLFQKKLEGIYEFNNNFENHSAPKNCFGYYYKTSGYKRNAKSYCYGGVNHWGKEVKCPGMSIDFFSIIFYILLFIVVSSLLYFISINISSIKNLFENNNYLGNFKDIFSNLINKLSFKKKSNNNANGYQMIEKNDHNKKIDFDQDDSDNDEEENKDDEIEYQNIKKNKINNEDII